MRTLRPWFLSLWSLAAFSYLGKRRAEGFWEWSSESGIQGRGGVDHCSRPMGTVLVRDGQNKGAQGRQTLLGNENGFCLRPWGARKMGHGSQRSGPDCLCVVVTLTGVSWKWQSCPGSGEGSALSRVPGQGPRGPRVLCLSSLANLGLDEVL